MTWTRSTRTLIGFVAFSTVASVVYIVNDVRDVEVDREHPTKRNRPIASGAVPVPVAIAQVVVLVPLAGALSWLAGSTVIGYAMLGGYLLINLAYSFGLKHIPILDVTILAVGFIVRVYYGADIANIAVSDWFYLTMFSFSFFVSFGKRRNEILQTGTATRIVNARYVPAFLDKAMYFSAAVAVVFYALWTIDSGQAKGLLIWTVPLVLVIFLVYILRVEQPDQSGDPIDVVTGSGSLLSLLAVYGASRRRAAVRGDMSSNVIDVYDFDKTIYDGDASRDFLVFCLRTQPGAWREMPRQAWAAGLFALGRLSGIGSRNGPSPFSSAYRTRRPWSTSSGCIIGTSSPRGTSHSAKRPT